MSEMVERVAVALAEKHGFKDLLDHEMYLGLARAAIEAMRQPTDEMVRTGDAVDDEASMGWARPEFMWLAMIDAALEENR